jgi:hypothetical protein
MLREEWLRWAAVGVLDNVQVPGSAEYDAIMKAKEGTLRSVESIRKAGRPPPTIAQRVQSALMKASPAPGAAALSPT